MSNILVTGATGFLGTQFLVHLDNKRQQLDINNVYLIVRPLSQYSNKRAHAHAWVQKWAETRPYIHIITGDISVPRCGLANDLAQNLVDNGNFSHVFHLAADTSWSTSFVEAVHNHISGGKHTYTLSAYLRGRRN